MSTSVENNPLLPLISESIFKKSAEEILKLNGFTKNLPNIRFNESLRKIAYNTLSAFADIADNSIDAGATDIIIKIISKKSIIESIIFADNGYGMGFDEADQALRLGSDSQKEYKDLGTFGCGLKTASLSQGRKVSIITKSSEEDYIYSSQDLDLMMQVNDWVKELRIANKNEINLFNSFIENKTGTIVEISKLDYLDYSSTKWLENALIKHFGVVYRKFIKSKKINFYINDKKVEAIDTVHDNQPTVLLDEKIKFEGQDVTIKLYELNDYGQHINKDRGIGYDLQGFHVFRNNREIMDGQTFGMFTKHPKYNFFRGEIYFDAHLDNYFSTDIKKSSIFLKQSIKDKIYELVKGYLLMQSRKHNKKNALEKTSQIDFDPLKKQIGGKLNLINTPKAEIEKRKSPQDLDSKEKKDKVPSPTDKRRKPRNNKKSGFINEVDFRFVNLGGAYGPIWEPILEGRSVIVELNQEHPFIVENILPLYTKGSMDAFNAVMVLFMAMSNYELKLSQQTDNFDAFVKMRSDVGSEVVTILN
jgi:hypothetical protein